MNTIKVAKFVLFISVAAGCIWYFFIKDYNYKITFTTPQSPGIVYDQLTKWNDGKTLNTKVITTLRQIPFSEVEQKLIVGDTVYKIYWSLEKKNDSITLVTAKIKDEKHSFKQNLQVPFFKNAFVKRSISTVKKFAENLNQNANYYKLSKVSNAKIPSKYCAYISLESRTQDKASAMVKNISIVMNYIRDNSIELSGNPFLEIKEWDIENDKIKFDFCFPIEEQASYPETNSVSFKKTIEQNALKVVFNGNYKISDRAWYTIMDYAKRNNLNIETLPTEIYLNDPHAGGNDLEWQAEIFMPLKQ